MSRRSLGLSVVVACALLGPAAAPSSGAEEAPAILYPRIGCAPVIDPGDDAVTKYSNQESEPAVLKTHPGTEIEQISVAVTETQVLAFMKVKNIPDNVQDNAVESADKMRPTESAIAYEFNFKLGPKTWSYVNGIVNQTQKSTSDQLVPNGFPSSVSGTTAAPAAVSFTADKTTDWVTVVWNRADWDKVLGEGEEITDGTEITLIKGFSRTYTTRNKPNQSDTTNTGTWTVGDDFCFGPEPVKLVDLKGIGGVQFGDTAIVSVKVTDQQDNPLADKDIEVKIGDKTFSATSGDDGVAKATVLADMPAATYPLTVSFAGDDTNGKAKITGTFLVKVETAKFNPPAVQRTSATTRNVTVQLVDDDRKTLPAGTKIHWWVNGKRVLTNVSVDAAGKAVYKGARAGQTVQAEYPGLATKYTATKSAAVRV